jgi:hypothetical protein
MEEVEHMASLWKDYVSSWHQRASRKLFRKPERFEPLSSFAQFLGSELVQPDGSLHETGW